MTDPIADMLTRIRNSLLAKHKQVSLPHSDLKLRLANKLKQLGYVDAVKLSDKDSRKTITLTLLYKNAQPAITKIARVSKPGRRIYTRSGNIKPTLSGHGATIISTSLGLLSDKEARKAKVGGEIICLVY